MFAENSRRKTGLSSGKLRIVGWQALNMATRATCTSALKCHSSFRFRIARTSSSLRPVHMRSKMACCSSSRIVRPTPWKIRPKKNVKTTERQKRTVIVVRSRIAARSSRRMSWESCFAQLFCTGFSTGSVASQVARPCGVLQSSVELASPPLRDLEGTPCAPARLRAQCSIAWSVRSRGSVCIMKITKSAGLKPTGHRYPSVAKCGTICSLLPS
mmetsp:Transcript_111575/g.315571  ORF Transcript_111575/g.315571 Transcript_111575/m.315571 type:complete len:214 (+) Transcript_111575:579-1220(+)